MPDNELVPGPAAANAGGLAVPAKAVSLRVRPFFASHLCFQTDGILGDLNLSLNPKAVGLLGASVPVFNFDFFYAVLGSRPTLPAAGSITFTTNPAVGAAVVLNGTTWTFVSALTTGNQLLIEPTLDSTLASAVKALQQSNDVNTKLFTYTATPTVLILTAITGGSGGNKLTFSTTVAGATASGPTLSGGDSSRLLYDFLKIQADVAPFTLATLRAEPRKAALNKAINARQNAYFAKYANQGNIISFAEQYYFNPPDFGLSGPVNPLSKSARLDNLNDINESRWAALNGAYASVGRQDGSPGVDAHNIIQKITSDTNGTLSSDVTGYGFAATSETGETTIVAPGDSSGNPLGAIVPSAPPNQVFFNTGPADWPWQEKFLWTPPVDAGAFTNGWLGTKIAGTSTTCQMTSSYQTNSNVNQSHQDGVNHAHQDQTVQTSDQAFRHPFYDAKAQYQRAQISLIDQRFSTLLSAQNIPNLATVYSNELASIDADVYQLQIAFLNTILLSPIAGVVTGIYKSPGDPVKAGEPVIRVENFDVIQIEAVVIFRGPVLVNQTTVTITTALFGSSSGKATSITGLVVAARIRNDDDTWHLIVECANKDGSTPPQPILPLGYRFDPDDTTIAIG